MDNLCAHPWVHLSNYPDGRAQPCCEFTGYITKEDGTEYYMQNDPVEDIYTSQYMKSLREEFRQGKRPSQCVNCWDKEEVGIKSKRQMFNERVNILGLPFDPNAEPTYPVEYQLTLNNSCNLRCRMCNPEYSSAWAKDFNSLSPSDKKYSGKRPANFIHKQLYNPKSIFMDDIDKWAPHLYSIEALGGDPLYSVAWYKLIDYLIEKGYSKNIHLAMSTNGTFFNSEFVEKVLANFKTFGLALSIDGVGEVFNYLRTNADWNKVKSNIENYFSYLNLDKNLHFNVHFTYSVTWFNVLQMQDFLEEINYPRTPRVSVNFLPITYPWGMAVFATSAEYKLKVKNYLEQISTKYTFLHNQFQGIKNLTFSKELSTKELLSAIRADHVIDKLRGISTLDFLKDVDSELYEEYKKTFKV